MISSVSDKLLYFVSMETKKMGMPSLVMRKGYPGEYFIDKLNPNFWDERHYNRKNFFSSEDVFRNVRDGFLDNIHAQAKKEEAKKNKERFSSSESSLADKAFLRKRGNVNIENRILEQRLAGVAQASAMQESLFENLKFSENSFCDRFLKKIKNK